MLSVFLKRSIKIKENQLSEQKRIGILGTQKGVGATHLSMLVANAYQAGYGYRTAVLEYNAHNEYIHMRREVKDGPKSMYTFCYENIDMYRKVTKEQYTNIVMQPYDVIVSDMCYGMSDCMQDFYRCNKRIVVIGMTPWNIVGAKRLLTCEENSKDSLWCSFGYEKKAAYELKKEFGITVVPIPFEPCPFHMQANSFYRMVELLQ